MSSSVAPLVSVVLPCYNASRFLAESLNSIVNQTYKNLEIIVIDDGSEDNTLNIIESFAKKDNRILLVKNESNLKLIRTLNKGIALANGKYIARMDSDDVSELKRIEIQVNVLEAKPGIDMISSGWNLFTPESIIINKISPKARLPLPLKFISFFLNPLLHPCLIAKSEILKNNPFSLDFIHSEDYELFSRLALEGKKLYNIKMPLLRYRVNPEGISKKYERTQIYIHSKVSLRNINNYFGYSLEYFTHRVMINRISFNVSDILIKNAFSELEKLKNIFFQKENCSNEEIIEIENFIIEQKMDILFQSIKHTWFLNKIPLLALLIKNFYLLKLPVGNKYFKSKVISKTRKKI